MKTIRLMMISLAAAAATRRTGRPHLLVGGPTGGSGHRNGVDLEL